MYFLRIRPFGKDFKPATSMAGGGGGGGGGGGAEVGALSEAQRQIIAATFNTVREKRTMSAEKLRESSVVLALSQGRLREQVEGLVSRMNSRLVAPDPSFQKIAEVLPLAVAEMKAAEAKLQARSPDGALPAGAEGAAVPAAGRRGVRDAGADPQPERRRWRRPAGRVDRRGPGRLVRARDGQDGQPVRDQLARAVGPGRAADRRAGREAEGAGAAPAAGARAPAPPGRRTGRLGRRRSAARAGRAGRGGRPSARTPVARTEPARPGQRRPSDAAGRRCDAARRGRQRSGRRRAGLGRRRAPAAGAAPAAGRPGRARRSATCRRPCARPRRSRASTPTWPATPSSWATPATIGCRRRS